MSTIPSFQEYNNNRTLNVEFFADSTLPVFFKDSNRHVTTLIDSGAAINCCAVTLLKKLYSHYKSLIIPTQREFSTADGEKLNPLGSATLTFYINKRPYSEKFFIFKQLSHSLILGREFLQSHEATLDFKTSHLRLSAKLRVHSINNLTLEPHNTYIISGRVSDRLQRTDLPSGLIGTISADCDTNIDIAETAVTVNSNNVPIMVTNNTNSPIFIYAGQHLALFDPLHKDSAEMIQNVSTINNDNTHSTSHEPFDISYSDCDANQKAQLKMLLESHTSAFMDKQKNLGFCNVLEHKIMLKPGAEYMDCQQFRYPPKIQEQLDTQIYYLLNQGVI